jgi:hypothetical protein
VPVFPVVTEFELCPVAWYNCQMKSLGRTGHRGTWPQAMSLVMRIRIPTLYAGHASAGCWPCRCS